MRGGQEKKAKEDQERKGEFIALPPIAHFC
jgi:hypothetical protein